MKEKIPRPYDAYQLDKAISSVSDSVPWEGREAAEYIKQLNIRPEDLEGKRVLDLGAGRDLNFARNLPEEGIHAEVVSLSPAFSFLHPYIARDGAEAGKLAVAGMAEELPFKENTFDTVVMFYVTLHIDTDERMAASLNEAVRVLKPEGVVYIGPLISVGNRPSGIDRNKRWLEEDKVKAILNGKAGAVWEKAPNVPAGAEAVTLRIVKNAE